MTAPRAVAPKPITTALSPAAVVARGAGQGEGVQHRAVAGQLVVAVEDVQADRTVCRPVVHGLEGDHRQLAVDRQLRHRGVLDQVRPAPQHVPPAQGGHVGVLRLGQQHHVGVGEDLLARREASHVLRELLVRASERAP